MEKLALTLESLRHLIGAESSAATLMAEQQIIEFSATHSQLNDKIENLQLLRRGVLPILMKAEGYPRKQYAESVVDFIDSRLRALEEARADAS